MRSSAGQHWIALDHIRAVAALLVFIWHFTHTRFGGPVPLAGAPTAFPLALFDEGHVGVALFLTLSGYLFAKLLDGKAVKYRAFFWNRFLRLAPLFFLIFTLEVIVDQINGGSFSRQMKLLFSGFLHPVWRNGGWSITVELHFYLLLPLLIMLTRKRPAAFIGLIVLAIAVRVAIYLDRGSVQDLAYLTIIGRIDQFLLGMMAFYYRGILVGRHALAAVTAVAFILFYWWFDRAGGYYFLGGGHPSNHPLWIILSTVEGAAFALLMAYYDNNYQPNNAGLSRFIGLFGTYSFSIYLIHFFVVFEASIFIHRNIMSLSNFYVALVWGLACFVAMMPIGYLSYRFVESPFLKLRRPYVIE